MITLYTFGPSFGLPDPSPFVTKADVLLKMSGLPYETDTGGFGKAPKGKLPYIDDGGTVVADSSLVRMHLEEKYGIDFDAGLTAEQKAAGWALEKMLENHTYWGLVRERWLSDANFDKGPRRFFDRAPAVVRPLVIAMIRRGVRRNLHGQGLGRHSMPEMVKLASRDIDAVSALLGDKPWLFGERPSGADATAFAFVLGLLCPLFDSELQRLGQAKVNLVAYRDRGLRHWYPELAPAGSSA